VVIADDDNGYTYRNTDGDPLAAGGTLQLTFEAETAGANRNVANGKITTVVTGPAGVTVSNPAVAPATTWITTFGADEESDAKLRLRDRNKWGTLSAAGPTAAYIAWALEADPVITRLNVVNDNPRGPGTTDLFIAGSSGALDSSIADKCKAYLIGDDNQDGTPENARLPLSAGDGLGVFSATNLVVPIYGEVWVQAQHDSAEKRAEFQEAILAYFKSLPVGGTKLSVTAYDGKLQLSSVFRAALAVTGIINAVFTGFGADIDVLRNQVAIPDFSAGFKWNRV
jgi:uncharacterized phage protein gp47/JayE